MDKQINVENAIDNLLLIIKKYQLEDIRPQVETLKYLREILNNDEIQSTREKGTYINLCFHHMGACQNFTIGIMIFR